MDGILCTFGLMSCIHNRVFDFWRKKSFSYDVQHLRWRGNCIGVAIWNLQFYYWYFKKIETVVDPPCILLRVANVFVARGQIRNSRLRKLNLATFKIFFAPLCMRFIKFFKRRPKPKPWLSLTCVSKILCQRKKIVRSQKKKFRMVQIFFSFFYSYFCIFC